MELHKDPKRLSLALSVVMPCVTAGAGINFVHHPEYYTFPGLISTRSRDGWLIGVHLEVVGSLTESVLIMGT